MQLPCQRRFLQNPSFAFKRNSATRKPTDNGPSDLCGPLPYCARAGEASRAPSPCFLKVHSFYAVRSTSSPPKSCRLLSDRGERGPEPLPGAALLRPFYRPGAGVRRRPRSARGRASQGSGEAPPRRSWRRGAAAQRAPLPRPPPRLGGASGGAPARPVSLRRAPPAAAGPGPAGIGAGGCDGRAG